MIRVAAAIALAAALGGCIAYTVVETAADVAGTAVDVTTTAVGTGVRATAGAVRLVVPDGDDEEEDEKER